jgi:2,4-dienoyl-CoA reductase-like NADH-dependent reductase (Old Yellow Enzyme family)
LSLEVGRWVHDAIGPGMAVFSRASATHSFGQSRPDEAGWKLADTEAFAQALAEQVAVGLIEISSKVPSTKIAHLMSNPDSNTEASLGHYSLLRTLLRVVLDPKDWSAYVYRAPAKTTTIQCTMGHLRH